ncbi:MAG: PHP domain-containing protein [Bryobacterales bacterium]|nr:PHP domain-containing protein [Bryobacterales bacterium]
MIDLHVHTTASDGTATPTEVIAEAKTIGLEAISITDHDTFAAYDEAVPAARDAGLQLIWGIEISTKLMQPGKPHGKTVHLLGYFMKGPTPEFLEWIEEHQRARHERNLQLCDRLKELGIDVSIDEVKQLGRNMAGRPHFARVMMQKGYVQTIQEAFDKYLDERGSAYVEKHDPTLAEGIRHIRDSGGVASLAHPIRLNKFGTQEEDTIRQMAKMGMHAIEAYHSDHTEKHLERYQLMARRYDMAVTGGSDYHGDNKPDVKLGTGRNNNVAVPNKLLDRLRGLSR